MIRDLETDTFGNKLFLAGEPAPSGRYKQLDGFQIIELEHEDVLPAALDGHATCYTRLHSTIAHDCSPAQPFLVAPERD